MKADFTFRRFAVSHRRCGMKVSTDGVLLGAWASVDGVRTVLDVGCGSGLLALMIAQRAPEARILAVDNDGGAIADACENVVNSPWSERVEVVEQDFEHLVLSDFGMRTVDLIISNPPFFATGERSADYSRAAARHESALNAVSLLSFAVNNLSSDGRLSMITTADNESEITYEAVMRRLHLRRLTRVFSRSDKPNPIRLLWEFSLSPGPQVCSNLVIRLTDNTYSDEYALLTQDFYL